MHTHAQQLDFIYEFPHFFYSSQHIIFHFILNYLGVYMMIISVVVARIDAREREWVSTHSSGTGTVFFLLLLKTVVVAVWVENERMAIILFYSIGMVAADTILLLLLHRCRMCLFKQQNFGVVCVVNYAMTSTYIKYLVHEVENHFPVSEVAIK